MNMRSSLTAAAAASFALVLAGCSTPAATYPTPDAAVDALMGALQPVDKTKLREVFGSAGDAIISSGDPVEDQAGAQDFLAAYQAGHRLIEAEDGSRLLELGKLQWTFPVPIVRQGDKWAFDAAAGTEEVLNRRVGENELSTIEACLAYVDAQREYALMDPDNNGLQEYARKFLSDPGTKNGLYWPSAAGEAHSPLGPFVVAATEEGYALPERQRAEPAPFHGYRFRMLFSQGANAAGGARDYVFNGQQLGGFALVAWPAQYGNSGVMTFIVNQDGVVYEKDLGAGTDSAVRAIKSFNPGAGWSKVAQERAQ